jgi:AraC-like DNA-binding protein
MRPFEYVTRYRLKCAKELLLNQNDYPIKTIAAMVGYNDTSYFCSTFREYEDCSPLEFKRMLRR